MTRKDFEMIAAALRDANSEEVGAFARCQGVNSKGVYRAAEYIADGCKADNPNFDRKRFLSACGFDA